jgi:hypothetical protein
MGGGGGVFLWPRSMQFGDGYYSSEILIVRCDYKYRFKIKYIHTSEKMYFAILPYPEFKFVGENSEQDRDKTYTIFRLWHYSMNNTVGKGVVI